MSLSGIWRSSAVLILLICGGAVEQALAAQANLKPRERQWYQDDLIRWKGLLNEYHQGKRDDNDGGAIVWNILHDYGMLDSTTTVEVAQLTQEWRALLDKHPEFKDHPPIHIHEEIAARQARRSHVNTRTPAFVPSDSRILEIHGNGHKAVFIYQYHLEFYDLPPNLSFRPQPEPNSFFGGLYDGDKHITPGIVSGKILRTEVGLSKPKTLRFSHRIQVSSLHANARNMELMKYFWVCSDWITGYEGSTKEEREITWHHDGGKLPWVDQNAEFRDFCGAVNLSGEVVYKLPIAQRLPDQLLVVAGTNAEGTSSLIKVGKQVAVANLEDPSLTTTKAGEFGQFLIWTYPDKLQTFDGKNMGELQKALDAAGLKLQ